MCGMNLFWLLKCCVLEKVWETKTTKSEMQNNIKHVWLCADENMLRYFWKIEFRRLTRGKAHWMRLLIFTVDKSLTVPDKTSCYGPLLIWVIVINNGNWWIQKVVRLSSSGFINTESSTGNSIWGISSYKSRERCGSKSRCEEGKTNS